MSSNTSKRPAPSARATAASWSSTSSPEVVPSVIVHLATQKMGALILALAGLTFLGLGVQPPTPEWGAMINDGRNHSFTAPHLILVPGAAINATVFRFNLLGDALRDALNPHAARR